MKGRNHFMPEGRDKQSGDSYVKFVCLNAKEDVLQVENWFKACAGTIYQAEATFLGGGGLHFSNWRGRNTEYFAMTRMALGMQTYGAGKLSPTPRPPRNPARGGTGVG